MRLEIAFIFIILFSNVSALCNETQIDINTATLEELDNLTGIGPVKAQAIIDSRPFSSVEELIDVSGIGNVTLNKIKEQGLACVGEENYANDSIQNNSNATESETNEKYFNASGETASQNIPSSAEETYENETKANPTIGEVIKLSAKGIKSGNIFGKTSYAIIALIGFSAFIALLFAIRKLRKNKNEF